MEIMHALRLSLKMRLLVATGSPRVRAIRARAGKKLAFLPF
jgi:hypothetical protein